MSPITISSIAQDIYSELEQPDNLTVPSIEKWLEGNYAKLNSRLFIDVCVDSDGNFEPDLGDDYAVILKTYYLVNYYSNLKRRTLVLGSAILSVTEGDTTIRRASKNETAKSYQAIVNSYNEELENLILGFKLNKATPKGIIDAF